MKSFADLRTSAKANFVSLVQKISIALPDGFVNPFSSKPALAFAAGGSIRPFSARASSKIFQFSMMEAQNLAVGASSSVSPATSVSGGVADLAAGGSPSTEANTKIEGPRTAACIASDSWDSHYPSPQIHFELKSLPTPAALQETLAKHYSPYEAPKLPADYLNDLTRIMDSGGELYLPLSGNTYLVRANGGEVTISGPKVSYLTT